MFLFHIANYQYIPVVLATIFRVSHSEAKHPTTHTNIHSTKSISIALNNTNPICLTYFNNNLNFICFYNIWTNTLFRLTIIVHNISL